ncbi:hypothetical protein BDN70DRAFT_988033 [Pholiota conissans]|uniref:Exonuclease V n=1 Tax=Pholiota conissans TaxID=109636 RepID=A0A9P5ZG34_9AGAR|nr:hypothetical protein BDN70DRAFT_988033 [Pholiota conissans]
MNLFSVIFARFLTKPLPQLRTTYPFIGTLHRRDYLSFNPVQPRRNLKDHAEMSDIPSDDFSHLHFSFSMEDLAEIDASVEAVFLQHRRVDDASFLLRTGSDNAELTSAEEANDINPVPSQTDTVPSDEVEEHIANTSFASDTFELNIGTLSAGEFKLIDAATSSNHQIPTDAAPIQIELEDTSSSSSDSGSNTPQYKSPLREFRNYVPLSVTDLCAPSWCEVQYDYGLRGRRSRPLARRPKSFVSSTGKTISPAVPIAQENDITTKQGQTIHKELEREIKYEELKVDITTEETRWALRLVNMIACLRGIMTGFTREMPVFGILHDEVVVGIMDEVVREEIVVQSEQSPKPRRSKRPSDHTASDSPAKRAKLDHMSQTIDSFFASPKKTEASTELAQMSISKPRTGYMLHIKDSKTRRRDFLPSEADMYSGRIQLMIYRRLLSELVSLNQPYNFSHLWDKLCLDSTKVFPTRFLVQAKLIGESDKFKTACLDDLVDSWNKLVKEFNIVGVDPQLELVYRLQPPRPDRKGRERAEKFQEIEVSSTDDEGLAKAIAASLQDVNETGQNAIAGASSSEETVSAIVREDGGNTVEDTVAEKSLPGRLFDTENSHIQWALQLSMLPLNGNHSCPSDMPDLTKPAALAGKRKGSKGRSRDSGPGPGERGIRRYKIIGTKKFIHDDMELDTHLTQVLRWWRGERKPEGVSVEHSYRCRTCEYAEDCEWRAEKALEHINRKK